MLTKIYGDVDYGKKLLVANGYYVSSVSKCHETNPSARGTWCTISASRQAQGRRTARKGQPLVAKFAPDLPCGGEDRQAGLGARPIITGLRRSPLRSLSSALCVPQILEQDRCKQMKGGMCRSKAIAEFLFCVACNGHNTRRLLTRKQGGYCRFRFGLRQG